MGLLDVLNGMQNGPRGPSDPEAKGGMSPLTMAILALLAYKAVKHVTGSGETSPSPTDAGSGKPAPGGTINASLPGGDLSNALGGLFGGGSSPGGGLGGGLGDLLKGGLGGLLAGGAAGSILSGGLGDLLKQFQQSGHSEAADSWVSPGPNKQISSGDLANALGADQIETLTSQTGLSREELLSGLAQHLPEVVNQLTPDGRLPTESEIASRL